MLTEAPDWYDLAEMKRDVVRLIGGIQVHEWKFLQRMFRPSDNIVLSFGR